MGLCKSCGKGLCRACAVDLGQGLACADSCEVDVRDMILHQEASRRALSTTPGAYKTQSVVGFVGAGAFFFVGAVAAVLGFWPLALVTGFGATPLLLQGIRARKTARALEHAVRQLPPPR